MNTERKAPLLIGGVIAAVLLIAALWWAISGITGNEQPVQEVGEHMEHDEMYPEKTSPQIAAQAALSQGYTWQPASMDSDLDGFISAEGITDTLRDELTRAAKVQPPQALPSSWEGWARSGDVVRAVVSVDDVADSSEHATVSATVSQRVVHPDGETTPLRQFEVRAELVRDTERWLLDSYEVTTVH